MLDEIAAELGGRDAPILEYVRVRAAISERERAQARASRLQRRKAANDALTSLRRGDIINIANGRRSGLAVVLEPARRRRRPATAGVDRKPLGGPHFVDRLLGRIGEDRVDDVAQAGGAPAAAGAARRGLSAAVGYRRDRCPARQAKRPTTRARRRPRVGWPARSAGAPSAPTASPTGRRRPAWPSDICASSVTTPRFSRRWPRPPTRWPAPSTASSCCSPSAGSSTTTRTATHASPTTAACWPGSTAKATCWWPSACAAACGRAWTPAELSAVLSAVLYESRGDTPGTPAGVDIPTANLRRALADTRRFVDRAARRRAAPPARAESRARRRLRHRRLSMGHHR